MDRENLGENSCPVCKSVMSWCQCFTRLSFTHKPLMWISVWALHPDGMRHFCYLSLRRRSLKTELFVVEVFMFAEPSYGPLYIKLQRQFGFVKERDTSHSYISKNAVLWWMRLCWMVKSTTVTGKGPVWDPWDWRWNDFIPIDMCEGHAGTAIGHIELLIGHRKPV